MPEYEHLHLILNSLNEFIFYFIFLATIHICLNAVKFVILHFIIPDTRDNEINHLKQRLMITEQTLEALITHINHTFRDEHNTFGDDIGPSATPAYPSTPILSSMGKDAEIALPVSDTGSESDSEKNSESKKDV